MKTKIFLLVLLLTTLSFAQRTTGWSVVDNGNTKTVTWTFTQTTDTTTVLYSTTANTGSTVNTNADHTFDLNDYNYHGVLGSYASFTIKTTKLTLAPNTAITLQGLYNAGSDTSNAALLRLAHVGQGVVDTCATFQLKRIAPTYRIKVTNTGGRIVSGVIVLTFTKPSYFNTKVKY